MGKVVDGGEGSASDVSSVASVCDYAPSPNTCSQALTRANQLRVQALLRQLLSAGSGHEHANRRLDTLRVLRRTMRELNHNLSWLTQVDFFETLELILRDEKHEDEDGRLVHDATQLLIESIPRAPFELEPQTVSQIFASVVQNLGHQRSEVRRASLLLINMYLNERPAHFQLLLRLFIDYGLANHRNKQAQRGAILSLPLLMTEQTIGQEDLLPLVRCLSDLLLDANPQLFYSLYLALQRLHMTVGDQQFATYLRQCNPEATLLYKQAASRHTSFDKEVGSKAEVPQVDGLETEPYEQVKSENIVEETTKTLVSNDQSKQVTFEEDLQQKLTLQRPESGAESDSTLMGAGSPIDSIIEPIIQPDKPVVATEECNDLMSDSECSNLSRQLNAGQKQQSRLNSMTGPVRPRSPMAQSSVSSTCSSEANLVDPAHYMNAAALSGRPLTNFEKIHHLDHSATGLSINDLCVSCTPTRELGPGAENELKFGIFPRHLVAGALNSRHLDRVEALEELMCIIRDSPINRLAILMTYFDSFLEQFLARLLETSGADFRVGLIAIDMIETIVIKTKVSTMQYVRPIVGLLVKSLADSGRQSVFRENIVRVIHKMMAFLPPQYVIDAIFEHKHSKSALVREESANRVTAAILQYDKNEFNLTKLCYHVLPMLADHQASVRLAALECIASLAHALGPDRIGSLLTAAEAVQTGCDYDGLLDAIHARIMRRSLPRVNPDGSVRYVIKPFLSPANATFHQEHQAADVRWVLEAPSRHQHPHLPQKLSLEPQDLDEPPAERPGHYAPQVNMMQRRRSVANLMGAKVGTESTAERNSHQHHHLYHLQNQQQAHHQLTQTQAEPQERSRPSDAPERTDSSSWSESKSKGLPTETQVEREQSSGVAGSEVEKEPQSSSSNGTRRQNQQRQIGRQARDREVGSGYRMRRSNSQSSTSSTDTNKVLFQYYLGKFKQSLTGTSSNGIMYSAALPSDSIIYTDVVQAYELSRHQSRYQQTSFDYDADSVGKLPSSSVRVDAANELSPQTKQIKKQGQTRKQSQGYVSSKDSSKMKAREDLPLESSGSESPATVMESSVRRHRKSEEGDDLVRKNQGQESGQLEGANDIMGNSRRRSSGSSSGGRKQSRENSRKSSEMQMRKSLEDGQEQGDEAEHVLDKSQTRQEVRQTITEDNYNDANRDRFDRKASLGKQSASKIAKEEEQADLTKSNIDDSGNTNRSAPGNRTISDSNIIGRQESTTTNDSQTRESSDHATQTTPQPVARQSRKRRNSKRSHAAEYDPGAEDAEDADKRSLNGEGGPNNLTEVRRRTSRSQPPAAMTSGGSHHRMSKTPSKSQLLNQQDRGLMLDGQRSISVSPSMTTSVNIRQILENVAETEGPFQEPQLAFRVAMEALAGSCWSTKVEGILALIRLGAHHQPLLSAHLHEVVNRIAGETRNLRSTVARSAIFALGDLCARLGRAAEPEMETIVQALLHKSMENTAFIRDDIRQALSSLVDYLTQWRFASCLITQGATHKNMHVRRMASQFIAILVGRMGAAKCLVGARDISALLIPAAAKFAQDGSPHTRYYGRLILSRLMQHSAFERLLRKNLAPNLYRSTIGIIESVKRRGPGDPPVDA